MFDVSNGEHVITVTSDKPIIGANFVFNEDFEPSMANAVATLLDNPSTQSINYRQEMRNLVVEFRDVCKKY